MKLIICAILFLSPAIGLANDSHKISSDLELAVEINIDTKSKSKKETQEEYKINYMAMVTSIILMKNFT